jgi:hypothetical protein
MFLHEAQAKLSNLQPNFLDRSFTEQDVDLIQDNWLEKVKYSFLSYLLGEMQ